MSKVKTHTRKSKRGVAIVKQHERKSKVGKYREAKEFSEERREKMASKGTALPDGSFPIASKRDLANAITSWGRAKNPEVAKRWIRKRAREMNMESMLPENW